MNKLKEKFEENRSNDVVLKRKEVVGWLISDFDAEQIKNWITKVYTPALLEEIRKEMSKSYYEMSEGKDTKYWLDKIDNKINSIQEDKPGRGISQFSKSA